MSKLSTVLAVGLLLISALACSLIERAVPGVDMNRTAEMWPDVPKMDHFAQSDMEMPLPLKIVLKTMLNNLWRANKEGEDKTPATGDWIVFTTTDAPADVQNFYTSARMSSFGQWRSTDKTNCTNGKENKVNGAVCIFEKTTDNKETGLVILAVKDDNTKQTNVFFLRVERPVTDGNRSKLQTEPQQQPPTGAITKLGGSAPYGIESRPMPTGTDLDILLPKQVGSYTRAKLERSEQRGSTPQSIETDGSSVYATYQNGPKEVFVEFSIASSPERAQAGWDVVVGDANEGIYPTDPKFGSFRTEPSYLKVINDEGAFFAWTRGGYFISADAKTGEDSLDAFMNAYPY